MPLIVVFLRQLGPYHIARFSSLSKTFKVHVIITRSLSDEYDWRIEKNLPFVVEYLNGRTHDHDPNIFLIFAALDKLYTLNRNLVLFIPGWSDSSHYSAFLFAYLFNIRLIIASDSNYSDHKRNIFLELVKETLLRGASGFLCAGTLSRKYLRMLKVPSSKICEPWDVVDNSFFDEQISASSQTKDPYILCVSRNLQKKNIPYLISEFATYSLNGGLYDLKIVGVNRDASKLRELCASVGVSDRVEILPFVQKEAIRNLYQRCRLFVLPSIYDQWGLVVNEAMASKALCIISEKCGCTQDLITNSETGWTFNPFISGDLTKKLLMSDNLSKTRIDSLTLAALCNLQTRFTLDHFHNAVLHLCSAAPVRSNRSALMALLLLFFRRH